MGNLYAYRGIPAVGDAVDRGMAAIGWERCEDVAQVDAVFSYFTNETALEDAYFEDDGLIKRLRPGSLTIDLSPASPTFARELSAIATVNDLRPVEAPLVVDDTVRPDALANAGNLRCFVAGEQADCDAALPLLQAVVGAVQVTGGCGTAQLAKAAVTLQQAAQLLSAIEAEALFRIIREGATSVDRLTGDPQPESAISERTLAAVAEDRFAGDFTVEMFMGEVAAVMMAGDDVELILPQIEAAMHLLEILAVIGGANMTPAALSLLYRDDADCAAHGLDWKLAEQMFPHDHDHGDDYGYDYDYDYGDDDYDYDYDDYPDDRQE